MRGGERLGSRPPRIHVATRACFARAAIIELRVVVLARTQRRVRRLLEGFVMIGSHSTNRGKSLLLAAALACAACQDFSAQRLFEEKELPLAELEKQVGYQAKPWWRQAEKLNDLLLAGLQIVISHRDAQQQSVNDLHIAARPERSREAALRLAARIRDQLRDDPARFAELARRHSDDTRTAASGGELGSFFAPEAPSAVIDAFGNVKKGDISRVVEAEGGFYIIKRTAVPAARSVAARHVVVKYQGAHGWWRLGRTTSRSRVEAQKLAAQVAAEAKRDPRAFTALADKYSDAPDAAISGDFGVWSTHERMDSVLLHGMSTLAPGEVSRAIPASDGYHVFQRTTASERTALSASHLVVSYASAADAAHRPPTTRSREQALALIQSLRDELRAQPELFDELRLKHCEVPWLCAEARTFKEGRGLVGVDQLLLRTPIGAVTQDVVETPVGFHLARREDPAKHPPQSVKPTFEFHRPAPRDLSWIVANASANELATASRQLGRDAVAALKLEGADAKYFSQILDRFAEQAAAAPVTERGALVAATQRELQSLLGAERWRVFEQFQNAWLNRAQGS